MEAKITTVYKQSTSLATIIPADIVREFAIAQGKRLIWRVEDGKIVLSVLEV